MEMAINGICCDEYDAAISQNEERRCLFDSGNLIFLGDFPEVGARATFSGQNVAQECCKALLSDDNG
ncbi:MAG TPA: hypothetical protein DD383_00030 [Rikenellaceae bacterium]|nr:hypothetical protein [Rikenellaceae bacterium]